MIYFLHYSKNMFTVILILAADWSEPINYLSLKNLLVSIAINEEDFFENAELLLY